MAEPPIFYRPALTPNLVKLQKFLGQILDFFPNSNSYLYQFGLGLDLVGEKNQKPHF